MPDQKRWLIFGLLMLTNDVIICFIKKKTIIQISLNETLEYIVQIICCIKNIIEISLNENLENIDIELIILNCLLL